MDLTADALLTQPYVRQLVRKTAAALVGKAGLRAHDRPDLEQELLTALVEQFAVYDPSRGKPTTFVRVITEHRARSILRERTAEKRGGFGAKRPAVVGETDCTGPLSAEAAHTTAHDRRLGRSSAGAEELAGLRVDMAPVLAALPASLRALAERLRRQTLAEAARDLGVPRSSLAYRVGLIRRR